MKISIIIPTYNEEKTISKVLDKLLQSNFDGLEKEIIVVDDGSSDNTPKILENYAKGSTIKLISHSENMGKGSAIRTGLKNTSGDIIAIQDADLEYDPMDLPKLIQPILRDNKDVVYGSRFLGNIEGMAPSHYFGNKLLSFATRVLYGCSITDMETCFKIFKKQVLDGIKLEAKGFEIEPELTAKILKQGYIIYEVPIDYIGRAKKEKKISWRDGLVSLMYLIKLRFK